MSSNKQFRIQNGVDIHGGMSFDGQIVISDDGKVQVPAVEDAVNTIIADDLAGINAGVDSDVAALQGQINTIENWTTSNVPEGVNKYFTSQRARNVIVPGNGISYSTGTGEISVDGTALTQNLVPAEDNVYTLGTPDKVWRDVYIGPGSLYIGGQKVIEDNSGTITINADPDQNLTVQTIGTGGLSVQSTGSGGVSVDAASEAISLKSDVVISVGKTITTTGGAATKFGGDVDMQGNTIGNIADPVSAQDAVSKTWVENLVAVPHSGSKTFSDDVVVTGNLTVKGSTTTVESETVKINDNLIDINSNVSSGTPTENAGIRVMRGDESPAQLRWNEASDVWEVYNGSSWQTIAFKSVVDALTTDDVAEGSNLYFTEARARGCVSADAGSCLNYVESTGKFSLDVAEADGVLNPDSSKNADKLDGQHGTYYRINVYNVAGTLVN